MKMSRFVLAYISMSEETAINNDNTPLDEVTDSGSPKAVEQLTTPGGGYQSNNRRLAKNTLLLYLRMIVVMLVGLYTSRVILQVLGVSDYGVYNAVGGVVTMLSVLSSALSSAISRYLTFELGRGDKERLRKVFSTSLNVQVMISIVILVLGVVAGGWFLNHKMNIPDGRMDAANWVLYCSLISFAVSLISVPYSASIVSHERMSVFAYMSVLEVTLKLLIVFALYVSPFDKLKSYAVLLLCVAVLIRFIYARYCKKKFEECSYHMVFDKSLLKEMTQFASWNFLGNSAWIFNNQGINILINIYFGVVLNAARGIAAQVEGLAMHFVSNFMIALNPQITKCYASGKYDEMHQLVCRGARFSFYLVILFAIPICLETDRVLDLWLGRVPDYSVLFVRMTFLCTLCSVLGNTLVTAQLATGKIKRYQIIITLCGLWVFPLTWLVYELGGDAVWCYVFFVAIYFLLIFVRIYLVKDLIHMPWKMYVKDVLLKCLVVAIMALMLPMLFRCAMPASLWRFLAVCMVSLISSIAVIYGIGMQASERLAINRMIQTYSHRIRRNNNQA